MKTTRGYSVRKPDGRPSRDVCSHRTVGLDRPVTLVWTKDLNRLKKLARASRNQAMTKIVREVAKMPCRSLKFGPEYDGAGRIKVKPCGKCGPCLARKLMKGAK